MYPAALVPDVSHLEEVGVQPRVLQGLPEQRLVRAGRAAGDDHPVQVVLQDLLTYVLLGVLGAGVQVALGVHDIGEAPRVLHHRRDVHNAPDVYAAVADEDADPWLEALHGPLRRVLQRRDQGVPNRRDPPGRFHRSSTCLGDAVWYVLRRGESAADVDA